MGRGLRIYWYSGVVHDWLLNILVLLHVLRLCNLDDLSWHSHRNPHLTMWPPVPDVTSSVIRRQTDIYARLSNISRICDLIS